MARFVPTDDERASRLLVANGLIITKGQPAYNVVQGLKMMLRGGRPVQSIFD
jgi:hypothetical protein